MKVTFLGQTRFIPLENGEGGGSGGSGGEGGAGTGAGDKSGGEGTGGAGDGKSGGSNEGSGDKAFTQADIDLAVKNRLSREKTKTDAIAKDLQRQLDILSGKSTGEEGKGQGGANENAAAADEALRKATDLVNQANAKLLSANAQAEALKLGIDPKFVTDAVKLADLSGAMGEDGTIDEKKVSKALDDVLKRMPVLKGNSGGEQGTGFQVGGSGGKGQSGNGWSRGQQQGNTNNGQQQQQPSGKRWNKFN